MGKQQTRTVSVIVPVCLLTLSVCLLTLSVCMRTTPVSRTPAARTARDSLEAAPSAKTAALAPEMSVTDDEGRTLRFDRPFSRIIPFYSAHTENLFALGAGATLIGGHSTCDYPPEAARLPVFEYTGDAEFVIAAAPDLVLIRPFVRRHNPAYIAALETAGIPVLSFYPETFAAFDAYIRRLALLTGTDADGRLADFHAELDRVRALTDSVPDKLTVFFETTANGTRTAARGSLPSLAIETAGGLNIASGAKPIAPASSIAAFGTEKLLSIGEDIDAYIVQRGAMNPTASLESLRKRAGFQAVRAVRDGKVLFIDEKLVSSPVFRFAEGAAEIARFLYPQVFADPGASE
jgi:iron complex transport system substrate-binding protein